MRIVLVSVFSLSVALTDTCNNNECRVEYMPTRMMQVHTFQRNITVGKYTVAADKDPLADLTFMNRFFKTEPRKDTPWGNNVKCDAHKPASYFARTDLVHENSGICTIITAGLDGLESVDEMTAVIREKGSDACLFQGAHHHKLKIYGVSYEVQAGSDRQCCLSCTADVDCVGANYKPGVANTNINFGVHLPGSSARRTGEALTVSEVETIVDGKANKMRSFDAWMDFSLGVWTLDLDNQIQQFDDESIPYLPTRWQVGKTNVFSVFVHVPKSQMFVELMTSSSENLNKRQDLMQLEPRLPEPTVLEMIQKKMSPNVLEPVRISRASTDLEKISFFYGVGMKRASSFHIDLVNVSTLCYQWSEGEPHVCFTNRPDSMTKGAFKVGDFERMLHKVAGQYGGNRMCNANRWYDNHYAVLRIQDANAQPYMHNYIIDFVDAHAEIPHVCNSNFGLYYLLDPTGWAVQFPNGIGSRLPKDCGGHDVKSFNDTIDTSAEFVFCDLGTCDADALRD